MSRIGARAPLVQLLPIRSPLVLLPRALPQARRATLLVPSRFLFSMETLGIGFDRQPILLAFSVRVGERKESTDSKTVEFSQVNGMDQYVKRLFKVKRKDISNHFKSITLPSHWQTCHENWRLEEYLPFGSDSRKAYLGWFSHGSDGFPLLIPFLCCPLVGLSVGVSVPKMHHVLGLWISIIYPDIDILVTIYSSNLCI